jgi:hypothetical protein
MGSANVHEEEYVSWVLIICAPLTDLRNENIFEPGPENGAVKKALAL